MYSQAAIFCSVFTSYSRSVGSTLLLLMIFNYVFAIIFTGQLRECPEVVRLRGGGDCPRPGGTETCSCDDFEVSAFEHTSDFPVLSSTYLQIALSLSKVDYSRTQTLVLSD